MHHHKPSVALWNETVNAGNRLTLRLEGAGNNRDAIGARLTIETGGHTFVRTVDGGGGYLSSNDPKIHVGLGTALRVDRATVVWPSGKTETRNDLAVNTLVDWKEH